MKTIKITLASLHNEEHFQFHTEFKDLVNLYKAGTIDIEDLFKAFLILYAQEYEALNVVRRTISTEELGKKDKRRNQAFRGYADGVKSNLNSTDEKISTAARRLQLVLDQYGNIARKSYDDKTPAIFKLIQEARTTYLDDITLLGQMRWIDQLETENIGFDLMMKERYAEDAAVTELRMKKVRIQVDASYRAIADQLDALIKVHGLAKYEPFVKELNVRVERYNKIIEQRKGRNAKDDDKPEEAK